ncbi:MAG: flagellar hook protein FlgE [Balneolaceae bacterium]
MSLIKSMNSGVSGLRAQQSKMDVIGNNIANVETTGFKSSRVSFAEMINQRMGRASGAGDSVPQMSNQVGLGVKVSSIDRDFGQGTMKTTGIDTDLGIEGKGFFVVQGEGGQFLTRAGNFVFNKQGFLVDPGGREVQGYNAKRGGTILSGENFESIRVDPDNSLEPKQTEMVTMAGNLDANTSTFQSLQAQNALTHPGGATADYDTEISDLAQVVDPLVAGDTIDFDIVDNDGTAQTVSHTYAAGDTMQDLIDTVNGAVAGEATMVLVDGLLMVHSQQSGESDLNITDIAVTGTGDVNFPQFQVTTNGVTGSKSMSTTVYDNLGRAHSLMLNFTQTSANEWSFDARFLDGEKITGGGTGPLEFDSVGQLTTDPVQHITFEPGGGASTVTFGMRLGDTALGSQFTQYSGSDSAKIIKQDGYSQGRLVDIVIDSEGQIEGIYDNGQGQVLAQIALGEVQNENGLETVGNGLFVATSAAGETYIDRAGSFADTSVNSGFLEASNVDLAQEFTEMITSQRAYQSSARIITTSDEMLMEAVNLKR